MKIGPGSRVLVTGATRGIGRATAQAFADRGCTVGLIARSHDALEELARSLPGHGHQALVADVGDRAEVADAVARFGRVHVAVANAGRADYMPFLQMDLDTVEAMTRLNWLGTVYTVAAVLPGMVDRGAGHLVMVSSGAGLRGFPEAAVYGATKAAQRIFAEGLWHELDGTGVSLTVVYPGEVRSSLHEHQQGQLPEWREGNEEAPPEPLAQEIVSAVERDKQAIYYPRVVRALRVTNGISPLLSDLVLRRARGRSAAPRR
jgi:short-subunit dehydrogenase